MRKPVGTDSVQGSRVGFMLISMILATSILFLSGVDAAMVSTLMSVFIISEEVLGRWNFYRSRL
jgi:hypothetical protein